MKRRMMAAFLAVLLAASVVRGQAPDSTQQADISLRFQEIIVLKAEGRYDRAVEELNRIITEFAASEAYLKLAYSHLVATWHEKGDVENANRAARDALQRFPDIKAEDIMIPSYVNAYYDALRREMFGRLTIQEPEKCSVLLGGKPVGNTPLRLGLVPVGEHDLVLTRPGYHDYIERIRIESDQTLDKSVSLERVKDRWWWITRVGVGAAVVAATAIGISMAQDDTSAAAEPVPLAGPPDPPK